MTESFLCKFCKRTYKSKGALTNHISSCNQKASLIKKHKDEKIKISEKLKKEHALKEKLLIDEYVEREKIMAEKYELKEKLLIEQYTSQIQALKIQLNCLNQLIAKDDMLIDEKKEHIGDLRETNQHYKTLVDNAGKMVNKSMSTFNKIVQKYDKAPAIKGFKDFKSIEEAINYNNIKYDLADEMINYHDKKKLGEYLGEIIIKEYKKDNPFNQSLWTTDAVRFTYAIRDSKNNTITWSRDKGARKVIKVIIEPLMKFVEKTMAEKIQKCGKIIMSNNLYGLPNGLDPQEFSSISESYSNDTDDDDDDDSDDILNDYSEDSSDPEEIFIPNRKYTYIDIEKAGITQAKSTAIMTSIGNGKLKKEILNKITPVFFPNETLLLIK